MVRINSIDLEFKFGRVEVEKAGKDITIWLDSTHQITIDKDMADELLSQLKELL